jgi:hypothetical protein
MIVTELDERTDIIELVAFVVNASWNGLDERIFLTRANQTQFR